MLSSAVHALMPPAKGPFLPLPERTEAPPPPPAPPVPVPASSSGGGDALPQPPDLRSLVQHEAENCLPADARQPLLVLRVSMLLQDAVEAACMCARAHIDAPVLAKHLLGAEQFQNFCVPPEAGEAAANKAARVTEFAKAVASTVGEVRPCRAHLPPRAPPPARARRPAAARGDARPAE